MFDVFDVSAGVRMLHVPYFGTTMFHFQMDKKVNRTSGGTPSAREDERRSALDRFGVSLFDSFDHVDSFVGAIPTPSRVRYWELGKVVGWFCHGNRGSGFGAHTT